MRGEIGPKMATDDERRLVECRLRELAGKKVPCDIDCYLAEAVFGNDFCETPCDGCLSTVLTRLADLINPSCDREALLALAEELANVRRWSCYTDSDLLDIADRIREACGEAVE